MYFNNEYKDDVSLKIYNNILKKIKNKKSLNNIAIKLYNEKQNEPKNSYFNINIKSFLITERMDYKIFKELLTNNAPLERQYIDEILSKNKYKQSEIDEIVKLILKNDNYKKEIFKNFVRTKESIFSEENLKELVKYFDISTFLLNQKNIFFLLGKIDFLMFKYKFLQNKNYFDTVESTKKFLNEFIDRKNFFDNNIVIQGSLNERRSILRSFFEYVPIDDEILKNYKEFIFDEDIIKNPHLTEEMIKKYCSPEADFYLLNEKVKVSKIFMKKQIRKNAQKTNPQNFFKQLEKKNDITEIFEEYITRIVKNDKLYKNFHFNVIDLLKMINKCNKLDFDVFEDLIERRKKIAEDIKGKKIILDFSPHEKVLFFNENTSEKHYKIFEEALSLPLHPLDYTSFYVKRTILNENTKNFINTLYNNKANIPEKYIVNYFPYFTVNNIIYDDKGFYEKNYLSNLIKNQKIPNELKTKEMFYDKLNYEDIIEFAKQIETKEEVEQVLNIIKKLYKINFKEEEFYTVLFNNPVFMSNINYEERKKILDKSMVNKSDYGFKIYISLYALEEQNLKIEIIKNKNTDYGFSF